MMNEFWGRMQKVSEVMTSLEQEHKKYFSNEEDMKLLDHKQNFVKSCIFWNDSNASKEEKMSRISWEYNDMFDKLVQIIDNNVEEWDDAGKYEDDYDQEF